MVSARKQKLPTGTAAVSCRELLELLALEDLLRDSLSFCCIPTLELIMICKYPLLDSILESSIQFRVRHFSQ